MSLPENALAFCYHCRQPASLRLRLWLTVPPDTGEIRSADWLLLSGVKPIPGWTLADVAADLRARFEAADRRRAFWERPVGSIRTV